MKYSIFTSFLLYFILFPEDIQANFTREICVTCCTGLPDKSSDCAVGCYTKFARSQDYNSRRECNRSCLVKLSDCRKVCLEDCSKRYEYIRADVVAPSRSEKKRLKLRRAYESAGLPVHRTTARNPHSTKARQKRRKKRQRIDIEGNSAQ